jgi:hypothetical protein
MMDMLSASTRGLARRLLAVEAASQSATGAHVHDGVRRALALARAEVPSLQSIKIKPDGSLEGCEALAVEAANSGPEGVAAIIAHLLGLLETFIGEPFTLRLVREIWPDASLYN